MISRERVHFIIIFLLVSFNLRMSFSAADPLLVFLMKDLNLSVEYSGLFGLLPIISLGIAAPMSARLAEWIAPRVLIIPALFLSIIGVIWRSYGGTPGLFGGTITIGLGLGITGSVILGIVKQEFTDRVPQLMGAYTACVSLGTAVGSGTSAPIAMLLGGWRNGLLFWALPLLIATLLWAEFVRCVPGSSARRQAIHSPITPLLRQGKAWSVSLFYLFRVAGAWLLIVWLATLMRHRGLPIVESGLVLAMATVCQIPAALLCNKFVEWMGSRRKLMGAAIILSALSCWGLLLAPLSTWPLFSVLLGLSLGCIFALGMTLIIENAADEGATVALSGMAQGIGFIGGGLLAWLASPAMQTTRPDLSIATIYSAFALGGLIAGWYSTRPGTCRV